MDCVEALSFAILINSILIWYFQSTIELCQGCTLSPCSLCTTALCHVLRVVVQGLKLEPYWPFLEAQLLSHHLFVDDYLLIDQALIWNARCFATIAEAYYRVFGQLVNL